MITFENVDLFLYDGDTETESGECSKVLGVSTLGAHMENGETWTFEEMNDYEKSLIIESSRIEVEALLLETIGYVKEQLGTNK